MARKYPHATGRVDERDLVRARSCRANRNGKPVIASTAASARSLHPTDRYARRDQPGVATRNGSGAPSSRGAVSARCISMQAFARDLLWHTVGNQFAVAIFISPGVNRTMSAVDGKTRAVRDVSWAYGTPRSRRDCVARKIRLRGRWSPGRRSHATRMKASGAITRPRPCH
jgi:hypothetical protein